MNFFHFLFHKRFNRGFTLIETMMTVLVLGLIMGMIVPFFIEVSKSSISSVNKGIIDEKLRSVFDRLTLEGEESAFLLLYSSIQGSDHSASDKRLSIGQSGDLLVFVKKNTVIDTWLDNVWEKTIQYEITKLIGYYIQEESVNGKTVRRMRRFLIEPNPPIQESDIESVLPSGSSTNDPIIFDDVQGLADGKVFYNVNGNSMSIHMKIIHENENPAFTLIYNASIGPINYE